MEKKNLAASADHNEVASLTDKLKKVKDHPNNRNRVPQIIKDKHGNIFKDAFGNKRIVFHDKTMPTTTFAGWWHQKNMMARPGKEFKKLKRAATYAEQVRARLEAKNNP